MDAVIDLARGLLLLVFPVVAVAAALRDVTTMTIPNWMSLALFGAFFPTALLVGLPPLDLLAHLGAGFAILAVGAAMFALRWLGGGDAKLLAAATLWLGFTGLPAFLLWTALAGGVFALMLMQARQFAPFFAGGPSWLGRLLEPKGDIPYGVAIAAGALAAWPASPLMERFAAGL